MSLYQPTNIIFFVKLVSSSYDSLYESIYSVVFRNIQFSHKWNSYQHLSLHIPLFTYHIETLDIFDRLKYFLTYLI
jgi:hypothetical protein